MKLLKYFLIFSLCCIINVEPRRFGSFSGLRSFGSRIGSISAPKGRFRGNVGKGSKSILPKTEKGPKNIFRKSGKKSKLSANYQTYFDLKKNRNLFLLPYFRFGRYQNLPRFFK